MSDYKKEWMNKAELDYFAPFINLWLACNSWYKSHYSESENRTDRGFIDKIKSDDTKRNHLYTNFRNFIQGNDRNCMNFKHNLENLHNALERSNLKPDKIKFCSLQRALITFDDKDQNTAYISIFQDNIQFLKNSNPKKTFTDCIRLENKYLIPDLKKVFAGVFETIYTVRNMLVHGSLNPNDDNHNVVKYSYLILYAILSQVCH